MYSINMNQMWFQIQQKKTNEQRGELKQPKPKSTNKNRNSGTKRQQQKIFSIGDDSNKGNNNAPKEGLASAKIIENTKNTTNNNNLSNPLIGPQSHQPQFDNYPDKFLSLSLDYYYYH